MFKNLLLFFLIFVSCTDTKKELTAQEIVDKSIKASGVDAVANAEISFQFRNRIYVANRKNGTFQLYRNTLKDSLEISEVLSNKGYERFVNGTPTFVVDSMASRYKNSINSVHYFSVLPYGLNDKAVKKRLLPSVTINGEEYHKIEITFSKDDGGEDYNDVFIYWIGKNDFLVDYLAYEYKTNGGGKRFRVLKEQCVKNGIRFVDYHNYKPKEKSIALIDIDKAFENDNLLKISEIILEDIRVKLLN